MPKRSKFDQLPEDLKEEVCVLWRSKRYSLDALLQILRDVGNEVSRSALHRGLAEFDKTTERYKRAQDYAAFVIDKLGKGDGDRDLSRLLSELIKTQAFETLMTIAETETSEDGEKSLAAGPMDLMLLGKMIQHLTTADKNNLEYRKKVREQALADAADRIEKSAKAAGLSKETIQQFRANILGVVEK